LVPFEMLIFADLCQIWRACLVCFIMVAGFVLAYPHAGPGSHWGPSCFGGLAKIPTASNRSNRSNRPNRSNSPTIHFQCSFQR
jgi:hypothetical protein